MKGKPLYSLLILLLLTPLASAITINATQFTEIDKIYCNGEFNIRINKMNTAEQLDGKGYSLKNCDYLNNDIWNCKCADEKIVFKYNENEAIRFTTLIAYDVFDGKILRPLTKSMIINVIEYKTPENAAMQVGDTINIISMVIVIIIIIVAIIYFLIKKIKKIFKDEDEPQIGREN